MDRIPSLHRRIQDLAKQKPQPGTLLSFTTIHHPPAGFGTQPYTIGLIQHEDGTKICAQLTVEGKLPAIGALVVPRMRRIRTMENGLFVNDLKYEVIETVPVKPLPVQHYVLALTGPSGVGKSTIIRAMLTFFHVQSEQVPIYTTHKRRKDEKEPYVHISEKTFNRMVTDGEMTTHAVMASEGLCGYRKADIEALWKAGKLPIVTTNIALLKGLSATLGRRAILSCGLLPPGNSRRSRLSTLLHRLRGRGNESEKEIRERLELAKSDLSAFDTESHLFDHLLVNDNLDTCLATIRELVRKS